MSRPNGGALGSRQPTPFASAAPSPRLMNQSALEQLIASDNRHGAGSPSVQDSSAGPTTGHPTGTGRVFHPDASLVLVGIRASGKRSLGFIAATALNRRFVTEDHYFQSINGLSRQDYLKAYGSEQFHKQDIESSRQMLEDNKYGCVIDCGLGSLTSSLQEYLKQYCETNPVVFVVRDILRVKSLLNLSDRSAKLLDHGNATHRKCSNFEFYNLEDESTTVSAESDSVDRASPNYSFRLRNVQADFSRFVRFVTGSVPTQPVLQSPFSLDVPIEHRSYTHLLRVRLSDFVNKQIDFTQLESAGDVVGIYVDQWHSTTTRVLDEMVAQARRMLQVPILISASLEISGSSNVETYLGVLTHGLRLGVEYMIVDLNLDDEQLGRIKAIKGHTKLIGSYANAIASKTSWKHTTWKDMYSRATRLELDLVRLLNTPTSRADNEALSWFIQELKGLPDFSQTPIAYNAGLMGRTSQIMNSILTLVTHPSLPTTETNHPNDFQPLLSSQQIIRALFNSYMFDPLTFYIVGGNVSGSLSPAMHNAAYKLLGLQHNYSTKNITSWTDIVELASDDFLGGLSIVQPYKVKVVPQLEVLSAHANAIGAVNTLVPIRSDATGAVPPLVVQAQNRNRSGHIVGWFGDNTDFIGIMNCINRSLSPRNAIQAKTTGLVVGAGGMARAAVYAMLQMGCKNIFVYNRTVANTKKLVTHFNDFAGRYHMGNSSTQPVKVLESTSDTWPSGFAPPTVVVSCVTHEVLDGNPGADFQMPETWLGSPTGGVVIEMAYMTKETPLIKQMNEFRAVTQRPWVLVDGIETLIEQALAQFESMTGRKAPKSCMATAVYDTIQANKSYLVDGDEFFA